MNTFKCYTGRDAPAWKCLALLIGICGYNLKAQVNDTADLPEVNITAFKKQTSFTGKRIFSFDSTLLFLFQQQNLGELLSAGTGVFIKQYGPGSLSSSSIRGGNAAQTAVLWNGINIQNSMLGQADLSLMPVALFNHVELEYGGGSSLWGSGAMGGAVHLNNHNAFAKGFQSDVTIQGSEIGNHTIGTNLAYSNKRLSASLKGFGLNGKNQFRYMDTKNEDVSVQKQAGFYQYQLLPEIKYLISNRQSISGSAWLSKGQRHFPPNGIQQVNNIYQNDEAGRYLLQWNYYRQSFQSGIKTAFISEKLHYNDSVAKIKSESNMRTLIIEQENQLQWLRNQQLLTGLNFTGNNVISNNYSGMPQLFRYAFFISNTGYYLKNKLSIHTAFRAEHISINITPVTYHAGISYVWNKHVELKANGGRVYRLPTLNDLYWNPGGNIHLKPEHGYTFDGNITIKKSFEKYHFMLNGAAFNRNINDWILWLPGANGFTHPVNVQKVWSRGTESTIKLTHEGKMIQSGITFQSSYILSTIQKNYLENHNTKDKQLIYTPRYIYNTSMYLKYKHLSLHLFHQYTGYRFTASDNSSWLSPYHLFSIRLVYSYHLKNTRFSTFFNLQNAADENYQIMMNRPMPLRYFEAGLNLHFTKNSFKK